VSHAGTPVAVPALAESAGSRALAAALVGLALVVPFEVPLVALGRTQTLTTLECAVLIAVAIGGVLWAAGRLPVLVPLPVVLAGAAWLAALYLAAVLSPVDQDAALRVTLRLTAAAAVALITAQAVQSRDSALAVAAAFLVVGTIVAALAVLEAESTPAVMVWLRHFRPGFHVVGGAVRATSTLMYPTIASMYLEVVFALGLGVLLTAVDAHRAAAQALVIAALAIVGAGIVATFTRSGLIAMGASLMLVALLRYGRLGTLDRGHACLALVAAAVVAVGVLSRSAELLRARASVEGGDWYGARYAAPATATMQPKAIDRVSVTVTNTGQLTWQSDRDPVFALSHHWMSAAGDRVVRFEGLRTPFPRPVAPGETVTLQAAVEAPAFPGNYTLAWDVVHEQRTWLSVEGIAPGATRVKVDGPPEGAAPRLGGVLPVAGARPGRLALWRAALAMAWERPLVGHGPDTFRLVYGRYLDLAVWDTRVHANNTYLDVLAGAGVLGLGALVALVIALATGVWRAWRAAPIATEPLVAAVAAAGVAILGHGLVDSFVAFTPTYVTFAIVGGLACSSAIATPAHAHRV
jgi:hypothetical protein